MVVKWNIKYYQATLAICLLSITLGNGGRSTTKAENSVHQIEDLLLTNLQTKGGRKYNVLASIKKLVVFHHYIQLREVDMDVSKYFDNPLNAFLVMKRLTADLDSIQATLISGIDDDIIAYINRIRKLPKFPNEDDLITSAGALLRLQKTYSLTDVTAIANGKFHDFQLGLTMTWNDCLYLGRESVNDHDYNIAFLWFKEALKRLPNKTSRKEKTELFKYLRLAAGELWEALLYNDELLKLNPNDLDALEYRNTENPMNTPAPHTSPTTKKPVTEKIKSTIEYNWDQVERYQQLCRKEVEPTAKQLAPLKCRYVTRNSPYLLIGPLKLEEVHLDPEIFIFHNVIYDEEIDVMKKMFKKHLEIAEAEKIEIAAYSIPTNVRSSKSIFLQDKDHEYVKRVSNRVHHMTGLQISTGEHLHIVNYGVGGHYDPHFDFFLNTTGIYGGNRIATILFYMNDVEQGGATVFPFLNIALWPQKGSAAFWWNLHKSGVGDLRTKHAGCPVLGGTKWVANKWLHIYDQEFIRPCGLTKDHPPDQD